MTWNGQSTIVRGLKSWPINNSAWAKEQLADEELLVLINKVLDTGGEEARVRKDDTTFGKIRQSYT